LTHPRSLPTSSSFQNLRRTDFDVAPNNSRGNSRDREPK